MLSTQLSQFMWTQTGSTLFAFAAANCDAISFVQIDNIISENEK